MKRFVLLLLVTLGFPAGAMAAPTPAAAPAGKDYVILKVGPEEIRKSEVDEAWKGIFPGPSAPAFETFDEKIRENLLRGVASEHVLLREAQKAGTQNTDVVKARIAATARQIVIQEFLKAKTRDLLGDDKLRAAYDARVKAMAASAQEEVRARHILVATQTEAEAIVKKLKSGADFATLAHEASQDKASASAGGDLGYFTADKMLPEFSRAAFALKKGEISAPVKTDFGWHVIQVTDRRKAELPSFEQMQPSLRQELGDKAVGDYVNRLLREVKITMYDAQGHAKPLSMPKLPSDGEQK